MGFVNELTRRPLAMARLLAANAPDVVAHLKRLTLEVLGTTPVQAHCAIARRDEAMMHGPDAQEGLRAFREGRAPRFSG